MIANTDSNVFNITISPVEWEGCGLNDDKAALRVQFSINGSMFHCYAYAVERNDDVGLKAVERDWQEEVNHVMGLNCAHLPETQPIEIDGVTREYVIVVYPYGD